MSDRMWSPDWILPTGHLEVLGAALYGALLLGRAGAAIWVLGRAPTGYRPGEEGTASGPTGAVHPVPWARWHGAAGRQGPAFIPAHRAWESGVGGRLYPGQRPSSPLKRLRVHHPDRHTPFPSTQTEEGPVMDVALALCVAEGFLRKCNRRQ